MLPSNVLKLRLDRIEQQGHHLSVKDQLKLVTLTQPDLTANIYTQIFNLTLPKIWNFRHSTKEDIHCALRLIQLITETFIPSYKFHAQKNAWLEQCLAFRLQYSEEKVSSNEIQTILLQLSECKDGELKLSVLKQLCDEYDIVEIKLNLAKLYVRLENWHAAIEIYDRVFQQQPTQHEDIHYDYIQSLLNRNHYSNEHGHGDIVEALDRLGNLDQIQQQKLHDELTRRAVGLLLPENLNSHIVQSPKTFIHLQHKLKFVGYSLNHWLSADEFVVPYYKNRIEQAPKLLNNQEVVMHLDRHKAANAALQKILTGRDLKFVSGINAANHSLGFIWNYFHINPLVLDALVTASKGDPEAFYNLKQIPAPDYNHDAAMQQISSYLAKQQVAYNLSQQGHSIEFVEHSHLAGFDLIVDGTPMQVKCTLYTEKVEKFAQSYPHIATIVNIELAHLQEKYPSVFADLALSYESVQRTAQQSLQQVVGREDFLPIPLMNTGFAVYRNFNKVPTRQTVRPFLQYKSSNSTMKNGLALGAAIGGIVSGSIGAFFVGGLAIYRTWRVQNKEQTKSAHEKQQIIAQRNQVMDLLIDFAEWFTHDLLKYRIDLYAYQLRQIEMKLMGQIPELSLSTLLFAYKFEAHHRAVKLYEWMQQQLTHDNPKRKVQAGWVALAQSDQFMSIELKQRLNQLNTVLDQYKKMTQMGHDFPNLSKQKANTSVSMSSYQIQPIKMSYEI